jgi:pantoate--beta-alanine ligase
VREADGLALSSRNAYLTAEQRRQALVLHRALTQVETLAGAGETRAAKLRAAALSVIASEPAALLDYFGIIDPDTLEPLEDTTQGALAAVAATFGSTRLIDNLLLPAR